MSDPLDRELSVGAELTDHGATAKSNSRFLNAADRLCGNLVELVSVPLEAGIVRKRAKIEAEKRAFEVSVEAALKHLQTEEGFARRAAERLFNRAFEHQINTDEVVLQALEDLRENSTRDLDSVDGPDRLDPQFESRFAEYAKHANTDDLRQRWGRVLASEVRRPGTFSAKVLRLVDELEAGTANLFEEQCKLKLGYCIPIGLAGVLKFHELAPLVHAGLYVEPGFAGLNLSAVEQGEYLVFRFTHHLVRIRCSEEGKKKVPVTPGAILQRSSEGKLVIPCYALTGEGMAIASILPDYEEDAAHRFTLEVRKLLGDSEEVECFRSKGDTWELSSLLSET